MKKIVLMTAAVVALSSAAFASSPNGPFTNKGVIGITNTKHDLATTQSLGTTQKCIFCHTPHNAVLNVPLWNRLAAPTTFAFYNSPTLTATAQSASITVNSISGLCMSCHDGVSGLGNIKNTTTGAALTGDATALTNTVNAALGTIMAGTDNKTRTGAGTDLTNDHPVGFDYEQAVAQDTQYGVEGTNAAFSGLHTLADAKAAKVTFYKRLAGGATGAGDTGEGTILECASCHKVHDDRIAPFLRVSNDTSQLCLACHIK